MILLPVVIMFLVSGFSNCRKNEHSITQDTVWPKDTWLRSSPEAQGVNSAELLRVFRLLKLYESGVDSMVIIKNGYCIAEFYKPPFLPETSHLIHS